MLEKENRFGGCSTDVIITNALENKIDYTILEQIEQLNRDGSHRDWSYGISIKEIALFNRVYNDVICFIIDWKE